MAKVTPLEANGWVFDFSNFTAGDFEELNTVLNTGKVSECFPVLQRIVISMPYGDPQNMDTYKGLNVIDFLLIGATIGEALNEEVKKRRAPRS